MRHITRLVASLVVAFGWLCGVAAWAQTATQPALGIDVLSSRPELLTGGDALARRPRRR